MGNNICSQVWITVPRTMVPHTMVPRTTTDHVITDKIRQRYSAEKALWTGISGMSPTYTASPVLKSCAYLAPLVKPSSRNAGSSGCGQADFWGAMRYFSSTSNTPPRACKQSGASNLNTCIYLKIISWREKKTPSIFAKLGGKGSAAKIASNETARLRGTRDLCLYAAFLTPETSLWRNGVSLII